MSDRNMMEIAVPFIIYLGCIMRVSIENGGEHHGKFDRIDQEAKDG